MKLIIRYEPSTLSFSPEDYTRPQIRERIALALQKYYQDDIGVYRQMYGANATVTLSVDNLVARRGKWFFDFTEQDITRQAMMNPRKPMEKMTVVVYEEEADVAAYTSPANSP